MRPIGIDGDMTSAGGWAPTVLNADIAVRFVFSSSPIGARPHVSPTRFRDSSTRPFGLTVFDGERRRYAFQRHPQNQ
jgi:hypothetical protein